MLPPNVEPAFRHLVAALAAPEPLPAGGAAAVTAIAMGIGLGIKVIHVSGSSELDATRIGLERVLEQVLPEFAADCDAFARLLAALRRPREDPTRAGLVGGAWRDATAAPVAVARAALAGEELLGACSGRVKPSVAGDLAAAVELVGAGRRIAESNARENAQRLEPQVATALLAALDSGPQR